MTTRRALLAKAHLGQKQMGLDPGEWRVFLRDETGRDSCRDLDDGQLQHLIEVMQSRGIRFTPPKTAQGKDGPGRALAPTPWARKLRALWLRGQALGIVREGSERALCSWASNSRAPNVTALLQGLSPDEWTPLIERLKQWLYRELERGHLVCPAGHVSRVGRAAATAIVWEQPVLLCPHCRPAQRAAWRAGAAPQ